MAVVRVTCIEVDNNVPQRDQIILVVPVSNRLEPLDAQGFGIVRDEERDYPFSCICQKDELTLDYGGFCETSEETMIRLHKVVLFVISRAAR